ncbi:MAG: 16S rRNA processing protein RimM, partial [Muribaculaceae bacterium]|nr:16S rRNA processing protein RimM [Muribaculaceae bacterium]
IGFKVVDSDSGETIGDIVDIDDTTTNVLFIVSTPQGKEVMIPAADELIDGIDAENETIEMIIDEGLLDL